jgi:DUF2933 family protein
MGTANGLMTTPAAPGWLSRPRGFVIALGVAAAAVIALGQHWLAFADLVPLLFVLPCAVMMFRCMKGMNHGPQPDTTQASAQSDIPTAPATRNQYKPEPVHWSG